MTTTKKATPEKKGWHTGEAARKVLEDSEIPLQRAADRINIAYQTLYRWIGNETWNESQLERFSAFTGIAEEWLRTGTGAVYDEKWRNRQIAIEQERLRDTIKRICDDHLIRMHAIFAEDPETRPKTPYDRSPKTRLR